MLNLIDRRRVSMEEELITIKVEINCNTFLYIYT